MTNKQHKPKFIGKDLLNIDAIGHKGDGIAHYCDKAGQSHIVHIPRTAAGDMVNAEMHQHKDKSEGVLGSLIQIQTPSPNRQDAPCVHYAQCGSCALQHITPQTYESWTENVVQTALARQNIQGFDFLPSLYIPASTRRRATFVALKQHKKVILGYHQFKSHNVTAIEHCLVLSPALQQCFDQLKTALLPLLTDNKACDVLVQDIDGAIEIVLTGAIGRYGVVDVDVRMDIAEFAQRTGAARIAWRAKDFTNPEVLFEDHKIYKKNGILQIDMPPASFMQPSLEGETALVDAIRAHIQDAIAAKIVPPAPKMLDLFCGSGTFSGHMLDYGTVHAIDSADFVMASLLRATHQLPTHSNAMSIQKRDLFQDALAPKELAPFDIIVFDPPRAGAKDQATHLKEAKAALIIAISCNPVTFARDARILTEGGQYSLKSIQIVDQFIWSPHMEVIGVFIKNP